MKQRSKIRLGLSAKSKARVAGSMRALPRVRASYARMAKVVKSEMLAYRKLRPHLKKDKNWRNKFFNNFTARLPGNRLPSTPPQLARDIDTLIAKFGINPDHIISLQPNQLAKKLGFNANAPIPGQVEFMGAKRTELCELVFPVYLELRRRGYSHKTLCT